MLKPHMPSLNDKEGAFVPPGLPPVIDTHVHIFPSGINRAILKWFDENAWHIRYQLASSQVFQYLLTRGLRHIVALQYAHKPGIARTLNKYMAEKCKEFENRVTGMATVFPGEDGAREILQEAFDFGLKGVKLHAHVQCFDMNADYMLPIYECCRDNRKPMVMHVGREPKSEAYNCDPYEICSAQKLTQVLKDFPGLKICVPHLGFDETTAYAGLIENYDNLWLDTTMVATDYFPMKEKKKIQSYRPDRIMYGSDFPNIPFAWDRELKALAKMNMDRSFSERFFYKNAVDFFGINGESL